MLEAQETHPMSDFVQNPEQHVARLKETRLPEVLTVNGHPEVVVLDTETYTQLMERLDAVNEVAAIRRHMAQARKNSPPQEPVTEAEMARRHAVLDELVAETERLGLYR